MIVEEALEHGHEGEPELSEGHDEEFEAELQAENGPSVGDQLEEVEDLEDAEYYGDVEPVTEPEALLLEGRDKTKPGLEDLDETEPGDDENEVSDENVPDDFPEQEHDAAELELDQNLIGGQPEVGPALPEMLSSSSKEVIKVGESVQLICRVKNLGLFEVTISFKALPSSIYHKSSKPQSPFSY